MRRIRGDSKLTPDVAIPLPSGRRFVTEKQQLQVAVRGRDFARYKMIYGFAGSISDAKDMAEKSTPLLLHVIAKLAYRYGISSGGRQDSYVYVRIGAFSSRACIDKSVGNLALGAPIFGFIDGSES